MFCCVFGMVCLSPTLFIPIVHLLTFPIFLLTAIVFLILLVAGRRRC